MESNELKCRTISAFIIILMKPFRQVTNLLNDQVQQPPLPDDRIKINIRPHSIHDFVALRSLESSDINCSYSLTTN